MEMFDAIRSILFVLTIVGLLWFATSDVFMGIWEKNAFDLGLILFWVCLGAGIAGIIFGVLREDRQLAFISLQTILQTIGTLVVLIAFLSPWGFVYDEFSNYYVKNICFPKNSSFDIYPFGRAYGGAVMYERGSLLDTSGKLNESWQTVIPRANCGFENETTCQNLSQNLSQRFMDYRK